MDCNICDEKMLEFSSKTISKTVYACNPCNNVVTRLYGLPMQLKRAGEMLYGEEMVNEMINILVKYDKVTATNVPTNQAELFNETRRVNHGS